MTAVHRPSICSARAYLESVLYILGGPARAGKTKIAESLGQELGLGWLSMDVVRSAVRSVSPELARVDVSVGSDPRVEADAMQPTFELVARMSSRLAGDYLIEGVGFMPGHVAGLPRWIKRRACFVGLSSTTLSQIDTHTGANDWHRELPAEDAARLPGWIMDWSAIVERECHDAGIAYVDLAAGWEVGVARVREVFDLRGDR